MVLLESPTNPLLKIADIQGISEAVHAASPVSSPKKQSFHFQIAETLPRYTSPHLSLLTIP